MITLVYLPHFVQGQHSELHTITPFSFVLLLIIAAGLEAYYYTVYAGQSETHPQAPDLFSSTNTHFFLFTSHSSHPVDNVSSLGRVHRRTSEGSKTRIRGKE